VRVEELEESLEALLLFILGGKFGGLRCRKLVVLCSRTYT